MLAIVALPSHGIAGQKVQRREHHQRADEGAERHDQDSTEQAAEGRMEAVSAKRRHQRE